MTIGIVASGSRAGAAVRAAVLGAESLGQGAIGGFAVFAVLDAQRQWHYCVTQRGGIKQLDIALDWLNAPVAAVISSGPDRPEPLVQLLPGQSGVGLVTGHRWPTTRDANGIPLNQSVLTQLAQGQDPQQAVATVLAAYPQADAGLLAITADGRMGWGNSAKVAQRTDLGQAWRVNDSARLALLHNSIQSDAHGSRLSTILADLAWTELSASS